MLLQRSGVGDGFPLTLEGWFQGMGTETQGTREKAKSTNDRMLRSKGWTHEGPRNNPDVLGTFGKELLKPSARHKLIERRQRKNLGFLHACGIDQSHSF
jgi:hypothetical protein